MIILILQNFTFLPPLLCFLMLYPMAIPDFTLAMVKLCTNIQSMHNIIHSGLIRQTVYNRMGLPLTEELMLCCIFYSFCFWSQIRNAYADAAVFREVLCASKYSSTGTLTSLFAFFPAACI